MHSAWNRSADTTSQDIISEHKNVIKHEYDHGTLLTMRPKSDEDPLQLWLGWIIDSHREAE